VISYLHNKKKSKNKMKKIVINKCYGTFGLSDRAIKRYAELSGITLKENPGATLYTSKYVFYPMEIERNDINLIKVVEELKENANGRYSNIKIIEIPDDVDWRIYDYDGIEHIYDINRVWGI
tara:strand:+ start:438 stop:803 length:366 start_codon:yes stop_codon:yes gene_type:complete